jgi:hypothetical protein
MTALGLSLWRTLTEIYMYDVIDRCLFASSLDDDSHESLLVFWKKVFLRLHQQAQQYSCRVDQRAVRRRPLGSTLKTQLDGTLDETWLHQGLNMHTSAIQKHAPSWPAASELGRSSGSIAR